MSQSHLVILGCSFSHISMIMESLYSIHGSDFTAEIIQNMKADEALAFEIPNVEILFTSYNDWKFDEKNSLILGVYKPGTKRAVLEFFHSSHQVNTSSFINLFHNQAIVSSTAVLGHGIMINPGATIGPYAQISDFVTINRNVTIGHHSNLKPFATINPGVNIAGGCSIGRSVSIGMGANILDGLSIGDESVIGAGALVTKDIPSGVMAYGVPAKVVKEIA